MVVLARASDGSIVSQALIVSGFARRAAIAVPASNEADGIVPCVAALLAQAETCSARVSISIHVLANNCRDGTADVLRTRLGRHPCLDIREVSLLSGFDHAGAARRMAMDLAAEALSAPDDIVISTDADSVVAHDWLARMLPWFEAGRHAVAGRAVLRVSELSGLPPTQRERLLRLGKYQTLLSYLRRFRSDPADPWPNHGYEGGASIALTRAMYHAIGGCPTIAVGEDRALFEAVRRQGGKIRHAADVRVFTSGRLRGRAAGGMADTLRQWCVQPGDAPIHETWPLAVELGHVPKSAASPLTFDDLPAELERARTLARSSRSSDFLESGLVA